MFEKDADLTEIEALFASAHGLGAAGVHAAWHVSRGVGHGIAPDGLELAGKFLADAFNGKLAKMQESAPLPLKV